MNNTCDGVPLSGLAPIRAAVEAVLEQYCFKQLPGARHNAHCQLLLPSDKAERDHHEQRRQKDRHDHLEQTCEKVIEHIALQGGEDDVHRNQ